MATEFDYSEVSAEVKRLGYVYPSNEDFTDEQVAEAITKLQTYHLTTDVATLTGETFTPATLEAFAKLARTLGGNVTKDYRGFVLRRETTAEERRNSALDSLKLKVSEYQREEARKSLQWKMDRDPEGIDYPEIAAVIARKRAA
jgi:hypothetical protein